jgi:hypothetical protein
MNPWFSYGLIVFGFTFASPMTIVLHYLFSLPWYWTFFGCILCTMLICLIIFLLARELFDELIGPNNLPKTI